MTHLTADPIRIELPTPFAVGSVNAYLFTGPEPVLVDCGVDTDESWQALTAALQAHGLTVSNLDRVVITHPHTDHFGAAHRIVAESDAQVWIADIGAAWLLDPSQKFQARIDYYRDVFLPQVGATKEMVLGAVRYLTAIRDSVTPLPASRLCTFRVGDTIPLGGRGWQVLHMPGHTRTQTCFYQPGTQGFLSADMLLPVTPTPIVEVPPTGQKRQPALPVYLDSLAKVEALEIGKVYPGHGEPFHRHRDVIKKQRARIEQRKEECYRLIENGVDTAVALTNVMYQSYPSELRSAGLWMLVGYLDLLLAEKRVTAVDRRPVRYQVVGG